MIRILHSIYSLDPKMGGTVQALYQLIRASDGGDESHEIICLDAPDHGFPTPDSLTIHWMGPTKTFYGYNPQLDTWLKENIQQYDIIIIHGCWQYHGLASFRACKRANVPYFQYTHGMLDPWFKRKYPLKHLKKWLYWPWAEYRILKNATRVIFTSEDEYLLAAESFWLYRVNPAIIPLGIEEPPDNSQAQIESLYAKIPYLKGRRILLYLGRIHEKKGLNLLLEALKRWNLKRAQPKVDYPVLLICGGLEETPFVKKIQGLAEEPQTQDHGINEIIFAGSVSGDIKWGAFRAAEVFLLPSHQENFGIAVVEALATATPVLTTQRVNIWREVVEHRAGFAGEDDLEGTYQLIDNWMQQNESSRKSMATQAKSCYEDCFRAKDNYGQLRSLIQEVINHGS